MKIVHKVPKQVDVEAYNYDDFHPKQRPFLSQIEEMIKAEGFMQSGYYVIKHKVPIYVSAFKSIDLRDTAEFVFYKDFRSRDKIRMVNMSFSTEFLSGKELGTCNGSKYMPIFPLPPNIQMFVFPQIHDIRHLYSLHKTLVDKYSVQDKPSYNANDKDYIQDSNSLIADLFEYQKRNGYLYTGSEQDSYRYTLKGAFLRSYRQIWAFLPIHMLVLRIKAGNMLKSLAVEIEGS